MDRKQWEERDHLKMKAVKKEDGDEVWGYIEGICLSLHPYIHESSIYSLIVPVILFFLLLTIFSSFKFHVPLIIHPSNHTLSI